METNIQKMIENQLPTLDNAALAEVHSKCAVLLAIGGNRTNRPTLLPQATRDDFARDLYDSIAALLQKRLQMKSAPYAIFVKTSVGSDFAAIAEGTKHINGEWFPNQTRSERASMLGLYAKLVLDYVADMGKPAVWRTITYAVENLPHIVNQSFPGYAESGLMGVIQRARTKRRA